MRRRARADTAVVGEHQRPAGVRAVVGQVGARVWDDAGEPPRVSAHQLGMGVDLDGHGPGGARVGHPQPEQDGAIGVGGEVGPLQLQPLQSRELVAGVAPSAGEPGGLTGPLVADPEPDPVDELQRRRPDASHLAGDVPAVGVEAAVLESLHVRALSRGHLPAVLQAVARRQLGGGGLRAAAAEHQPNDPQHHSTVEPLNQSTV